MTLRIWGRKTVANVQKVTWCVGELGIAHEYSEDDPSGQAPFDARYLDLKKGATVPLMDDDGFVLWEGNAIARYLAEKYGRAPFWPTTAAGRAEVGRWMDYQLSTARVYLHPLIRETLDKEEVARNFRLLAACMEVVELALERRQYLAGDDFTVGDIPLGIVAYRWFLLDKNRPSMPAIEAWYRRLAKRPAFQRNMFPPEDSFTPVAARQA